MSHWRKTLLLAGIFSGLTASAWAVNPFTDVNPDSWAYQSVMSLAEEGLVTGYPDGSFGGGRSVTRFEMAQMIARLQAREDVSIEQRQTIQRLAKEFSEELNHLGAKVSELEQKASGTQIILEARFHYMPVYDNLFTNDGKDVYGARIRLNTISKVNDRFTVYGQLQTLMTLGATPYHESDYYDIDNKNYLTDNSEDGKVRVNRLFATYHFGGRDGNDRGFGPSRDVIGIGMFPVRIGNTGYTYDGSVKGVSLQLGDSHQGGRLTVAYGNATNINYNYTSPMMKGIDGLGNLVAQAKGIPTLYARGALAKMLGSKYDATKDIYYPMDDVRMGEGEDADVPVAYASYIYKNPKKYEIHLYGMKAAGPVNNIAKAYGFALGYRVTPKWNFHGEFAKNLVKLPLNNERPYSWNAGISFGTADVLQERSYSFGIDYIYSKAGSYFGGSSSDVADQYMGHVYNDWHGKRMPAYIADKLDAVIAGTDDGSRRYGGAKFYLAKLQYVPKKGLILEAQYGFGAKDMSDRKMDNILRLQATMFYK